MYVGTEQVLQQWRRDKYVPGLGTFSVPGGVHRITQHVYVCDQCGRRTASPFQAAEPFYCHSQACQGGTLVSLAQAEHLTEPPPGCPCS